MGTMIYTKISSLFTRTISKKPKKEKLITIASKRIVNNINSLKKGILIKEKSFNDWTLYNRDIKGFIYEDGYEYELIVSENDIEKTFSLVRVLTKTKKLSENLPC
ncbi:MULTISPECIES: DUF4377 domain-containing protein [Tenacibaculum]|uniref:DUF4377 domain-containing protein n=1 Tax=Tenacibaculum TaxID=104267 RepID=UPI000899D54D|nr:DUF4377 domain-containing protein [Tenacibaculum sp. MAR_2010_89]SED98588.1 protein of unknown function [Tenacibaculum sp. MAR_2010_89]